MKKRKIIQKYKGLYICHNGDKEFTYISENTTNCLGVVFFNILQIVAFEQEIIMNGGTWFNLKEHLCGTSK